MAVPRNIGSFEDKKFREALFKMLASGRRTLFNEVNVEINAVASDRHFFDKTFSSSLFKTLGDTVFLTFAGKVAAGAGTPVIGFRIFGSDSGSSYAWLLEADGGKSFTLAANSNFYGICSATLTAKGVLSGNGMIFNDGTASPLFVSRDSGSIAGENLTISGLYTSLVFASDVTFDFIKIEYSPGIGLHN